MTRHLRATYRLQLRPELTFDDAAAIVPYLADLGISHVYLSPTTEAVAGSTHGYDGVDPTRLRGELGGDDGFARLVAATHAADMGIVVDLVPHHLAADAANPWWWALLAEGQDGPAGAVFDVDWNPPERHLRHRVLLPVLGDHYGRELEAGNIGLRWEQDHFEVTYYDLRLPVAPDSADRLLATLDSSADRGEAASELAAKLAADADRLHDLLEEQHYRLARWQAGSDEIDYRRFFDIDSLVALRTERAEVAALTTDLPVRLHAEGAIDGFRLDHVDGLREPAAFLTRLRDRAPEAWITVEKILAPGEVLPEWPVDGTTGYDLLSWSTRLLVDGDGVRDLHDAYRHFTGDEAAYPEVRLAARREVVRGLLRADLERVVEHLVRWCEASRRWRDLTRRELRTATVEVATHLDRYRTYLEPGRPASDVDRRAIALACAAASVAPGAEPAADAIELLSTMLVGDEVGAEDVVARFQQLTAPLAAKGEEDSALYRWTPCLALNDVGNDPHHGGATVDAFHDWAVGSSERHPRAMTTTSTHDTKRSEDVRARLAALTELARPYAEVIRTWTEVDETTGALDDGPLDRGARWVVHQLLAGAHPIDDDRAWAATLKSLREAGTTTSWTATDEGYEQRAERFVRRAGAWTAASQLDGLLPHLVRAGRWNSLVVAAVRLLGPGIPDTYQGCELYDLSLVDPDNRRAVDYDKRRALLQALDPAAPFDPDEPEGVAKLAVVRTALRLRSERPAAFDGGGYAPLEVAGTGADRTLAFARGDDVAVVAGLRSTAGVPGATVALPPGTWADAATGAPVDGDGTVAAILAGRPVAILERQ